MSLSEETVMRVLKLTSFEYTDEIWWRWIDDEDLTMFVQCSDVFEWACADAEEITDENIQSLEDTLAEVQSIVGRWDAHDAFVLWVARVREKRPQGAYYKHMDTRLHPLFDAAGPERPTGLGNPIAHPKDVTANA